MIRPLLDRQIHRALTVDVEVGEGSWRGYAAPLVAAARSSTMLPAGRLRLAAAEEAISGLDASDDLAAAHSRASLAVLVAARDALQREAMAAA